MTVIDDRLLLLDKLDLHGGGHDGPWCEGQPAQEDTA